MDVKVIVKVNPASIEFDAEYDVADIQIRGEHGWERATWETGEGSWARSFFTDGHVMLAIYGDYDCPHDLMLATKFIVRGKLWSSRDYWGEFDEGFEIEEIRILERQEPTEFYRPAVQEALLDVLQHGWRKKSAEACMADYRAKGILV